MLLTVHRVCSRRSLVQTCVLVREDKADVDVRALLFDQDVLGTILNSPDAFSLDIKKAPLFGELEVRRVLRPARWNGVLDLFCLIEKFDPSSNDLVTDLLL